MKLLCDFCEKAMATVICCADEAALCLPCDARIHAANKLASKHLRIAVLADTVETPSSCDICQERPSLFFCIEDRALLCRGCDCSIHSTNAVAAKHKRFLLTGVKVGMDAMSAVTTTTPSSSSQETISMMGNSEQQATPGDDIKDNSRNKNCSNSSKKHKSTPMMRSSMRAPAKTHSVQRYDMKTCEQSNGIFDVCVKTNQDSAQRIQDTRTFEQGNKTLEPMMKGLLGLDSAQSYAGQANEPRGETLLSSTVHVQDSHKVQAASEESKDAPLLRSVPRLSIQRLTTGTIAFIAPVLSTLQVPCSETAKNSTSDNNTSTDLEMESPEVYNQKPVGIGDSPSSPELEWRLEDLLTELGDMCETGHPASPKLASCY